MTRPTVTGFLATLCLLVFTASVLAEQIDPSRVRVIDAVTVAVDGQPRNIRLLGFNAPQIRNARCENEARLGLKATNRLKELLQNRPLELTIVRCACKPGTESTKRCNHGRSCGVLNARGWSVGEILIDEGLAVPFECGETSCPKAPQPWCG